MAQCLSTAATVIRCPFDGAMNVSARARYTRFNQISKVLKKGSIYCYGAKSLPCDIVMERDVPMKLRDGTVITPMLFVPTTTSLYLPSSLGAPTEGRSVDNGSMMSGTDQGFHCEEYRSCRNSRARSCTLGGAGLRRAQPGYSRDGLIGRKHYSLGTPAGRRWVLFH